MSTYMINDKKVDGSDPIAFINNPKRPGKKAHARYSAYENVTTLDEYFDVMADYEQDGAPLKQAVMKADLRYDEMKGYLYLVDEEPTAEDLEDEDIEVGLNIEEIDAQINELTFDETDV